MLPYRLYIQQIKFDGSSYAKGDVFDTYSEWGIACKEFPFMILPEPKPVVTRNWSGEDGLEIYVPTKICAKEYDIDTEFIIKGDDNLSDDDATDGVITNIKSFIKFLYGEDWDGQDICGGVRLAIYDTYTKIGRKDIVLKKINPNAYERQNGGNSAVIVLKMQFAVYDPTTEVTPVFNQSGEITELTW